MKDKFVSKTSSIGSLERKLQRIRIYTFCYYVQCRLYHEATEARASGPAPKGAPRLKRRKKGEGERERKKRKKEGKKRKEREKKFEKRTRVRKTKETF